MGFFSKIKENLSHGGVDVTIQAPDTISLSDSGFNVTLTFINKTNELKVINSASVVLVEDRSMGEINNPDQNQEIDREVSKTEVGTLQLNANETKQMTLNIMLNFGKNVAEQAGDNPIIAGVANVVGVIQQYADATSKSNYKYYLKAVADVEGIALDPSAQRSVHVLKPGQIGTSWQIGS